MLTPFSKLSWWQKKKFQWEFRDPQYLHMLKHVREQLVVHNGYVCNRVLDAGAQLYQYDQDSPQSMRLVNHISHIQGVDTYDRWMARHDAGAGSYATHLGRKVWVGQMIKALEH